MERSTASLSYRGSVSDAIVEAQKQKKLFLVYVSGDDENSARLELSTWVDKAVGESISKYCIFLHLMQESTDALQFAAIYPQKSVPSITTVGYNGMMLWQHEGYISPENLASNIEKAWAALHFQETAVSFLTAAALAARKSEPLKSSSEDIAPENSSTVDIASTSAGKSSESLEDRPIDDSKLKVEKTMELDSEASLLSEVTDDMDIEGAKESKTLSSTREVTCSSAGDVQIPSSSNDVHVSDASRETIDKICAESSPVSLENAAVHGPISSQNVASKKEKNVKIEEVANQSDCSGSVKSNNVHLNIRLPNGASLQKKFLMTDPLKLVKEYVDENQTSGSGLYDLAMPYPRKVFNEEDVDCALFELGFGTRQALIVVPHRHASNLPRSFSSSNDSQTASRTINPTGDNAGYFALLKRVLSLVNPFSYLGASNADSSNPEPPTIDGYEQHGPNSAFQNRQSSGPDASSRPFGLNPQNPSAPGNAAEMRRRTSRPFGSNIHTLKHDEDELQSDGRNMFWNGNSTQFGGDDKN